MSAVIGQVQLPAAVGGLRLYLAKQALLGGRSRLALYRRLGRFASRGFDVKVPLEDMLTRARQRKRDTAHVLETWLKGINNGQRFSDILGSDVPAAERMAIASGEETGNTDEGFAMAAYIVESNARLRSALVAGLAYPILLVISFAIMLGFIAWLVIPVMEQVYSMEFWPPVSAALWYVAAAVRHYGAYTGAALVAFAVLALWTLPRWTAPVRLRLDHHLPPWSIYREMQSGMLLVTLAGAVKSGSPIDEAIRRLRRSGSPWLNVHLERAMRSVAEGHKPSVALNTGLFSESMMDDLMAYDRAGDLTDSILMLGQDCVELVAQRIKAMCDAVRIALMLAVGGSLIWTWMAFLMVFIAMRSNNQGI